MYMCVYMYVYIYIYIYTYVGLCMFVCLNPTHGIINVVPPFEAFSQETVFLLRLIGNVCFAYPFPVAACIATRLSEEIETLMQNCVSRRCIYGGWTHLGHHGHYQGKCYQLFASTWNHFGTDIHSLWPNAVEAICLVWQWMFKK